MRSLVKVLLLSELFAVATYAFGWWTVPIIGAIWALVSHDARRAMIAALCAAIGWGSLLLLDTIKGPVGEMANRLGGVMRVPAVVLILLTLIFPALLAWCSAALVESFRGRPAATAQRQA